jgi:hypothetical protein
LAKQLAGMVNREFIYLDLQDERDRVPQRLGRAGRGAIHTRYFPTSATRN